MLFGHFYYIDRREGKRESMRFCQVNHRMLQGGKTEESVKGGGGRDIKQRKANIQMQAPLLQFLRKKSK